jgi:hypothetical protein
MERGGVLFFILDVLAVNYKTFVFFLLNPVPPEDYAKTRPLKQTTHKIKNLDKKISTSHTEQSISKSTESIFLLLLGIPWWWHARCIALRDLLIFAIVH